MDSKVLVILFTIFLSCFILYSGSQAKHHNLVTQQEAEAYEEFFVWKSNYARSYREDEETSYRFRKFFENYLFVKEHNQKYEKGLSTFKMKLNQFADLDNAEYASLYADSLKPNLARTNDCKGKIDILDKPPASVDWEDKAETPIVNQGMCGSSWAFSAIVGLQGIAAIKTGKVVKLSCQQLLDCSQEYGNYGCNGGWMDASFYYVQDNGITSDEQYPYTAKSEKCKYDPSMKVFQNSGCAHVPANTTVALQSALAKQPVAGAIDASSRDFQMYSSGVFTGSCTTRVNHGMAITGYGTLDGKDYWKCKNSWGKDWGDHGYILLERDGQDGPGKCGVMETNSVPLA